jgi:DNA-binding winged helix-turn-helix (wHTH) protein/tetratricopeptide (TPR) repeat protein
MPEAKAFPGLVRFEGFELDLRSGELRKDGADPILLPEQSFQILKLLLEQPGEVVGRRQIQERLWPDGTIVEFEHSISAAMNRLRQTLGDATENPRYIETLSRRGYRFIARMQPALAPSDTLHQDNHRPASATVPNTIPKGKQWPVWRSGSLPRVILVPVIAVVTALIASGLYLRSRSKAKLTDKDTIVLADFTNTTGDPVFDDTLKQALSVQLEQSPFLNILSNQKINETLKLMSRKPGERITQDTAWEICQRTHSKALLAGSIASLGSNYLVGLKAVNCQTGDSLGSAVAEAGSRENVLKALSEVGNTLRGKLGESLASIRKYDKPLDEATTPSLEALQAFTQSNRVDEEKGILEALPYLRRAVEIDPNFAMALANLGVIYDYLGQEDLAIETLEKAFDLRNRVSEKERFFIEGIYYQAGTRELDKSIQVFTQWVQTYPNDDDAHQNLSDALDEAGQFEKAATDLREYVRQHPDKTLSIYNLAATYLVLNRFDEAKNLYKQLETKMSENSFAFDTDLYMLAFAQGDRAGMQQHFNAAMGRPGAEDIILALQSATEAYYGHLVSAREFSYRAFESARKNSAQQAALAQVQVALREAEFGNSVEARRQVEAVLTLKSERDTRALAALVLARARDAAQAQKLSERLNQEFPLDTLMQSYLLPTVDAVLALNRGDGKLALVLLKKATAYELAMTKAPPLYASYVRGEAYLNVRQGPLAAAEFQKIIDHRGLILIANSSIGALAHLQLGRAYDLQGDTAKAKAAYQDFLTLWKDADPDIPILKQAKAEYAKLQ